MTRITKARAGRQLDEELTAQIMAETVRQLRLGAYPNLRVERVAANVGCGKTAIYRRWKTKEELATAALASISRVGEQPDTGNIVDDLVGHAWRNVENQRSHDVADEGKHNVWASLMDPKVRELFWDQFLSLRRQAGIKVIERGISRGELSADANPDLILDALAGLTLYRNTIRISPLTMSDVKNLVSALVLCFQPHGSAHTGSMDCAPEADPNGI